MKTINPNSFTLFMKPNGWQRLYQRCFDMQKIRYAEPTYFIVRVQFGELYIVKREES